MEPVRYTLTRDGEPDVQLEGFAVGAASNHTLRGAHQNRWTEVEVYRTKGGKYVAAVVRRSQWQGENDVHRVVVAESAAALLAELAGEGDVVDLVKEVFAEGSIEAPETIE